MIIDHDKSTKNPQPKDDTPGISIPKNLMVPILLVSLSNFNLHGYKLIQELTRFGFTAIDQGNVYRTLRKLEKDQLVHSEWDIMTEGPAKRIYSITDSGKDYLKTCSTALEQYQSMINHFFTMYMNMFLPSSFTQYDNTDE